VLLLTTATEIEQQSQASVHTAQLCNVQLNTSPDGRDFHMALCLIGGSSAWVVRSLASNDLLMPGQEHFNDLLLDGTWSAMTCSWMALCHE